MCSHILRANELARRHARSLPAMLQTTQRERWLMFIQHDRLSELREPELQFPRGRHAKHLRLMNLGAVPMALRTQPLRSVPRIFSFVDSLSRMKPAWSSRRTWQVAHGACAAFMLSEPALAQSALHGENDTRRAVVALALRSVQWRTVLPDVFRSTRTEAVVVVREVASSHAGTITRFENDAPYTILNARDVPQRLRSATGNKATLIAQRDSETPLGRDTLAVVVAVSPSSALGSPMSLVDIELYFGTSSSLGGAQVWIAKGRRTLKLVKMVVSVLPL